MRAVFAVLVAMSSLAHAQPGMTEPVPPPAPVAQKDAGVATVLSLAGTGAPVLIVLAASGGSNDGTAKGVLLAGVTAMFAPSAGHWYAGTFFTPGMGIRIASGALATGSLFLLIASEGEAGEGVEHAFWLGVIGLGVGAVYDIATAPERARAWNRRHAPVTPTVLKIGDGYGAGLVGRF
jgi:hypothetical protein